MRLVVLFGGRSAEHDVSCVSARHIAAAADPAKYEVVPVGITREGRWVRAEKAAEALRAGQARLPESLIAEGPSVDPLRVLAEPTTANALETAAGAPRATGPPAASGASAVAAPPGSSRLTVVLPALHGPMGEDGTVQGLLELAAVPYVGAGVLASALCMDKPMTKAVLAAAGIPHARWRAFKVDETRADDSRAAGPSGNGRRNSEARDRAGRDSAGQNSGARDSGARNSGARDGGGAPEGQPTRQVADMAAEAAAELGLPLFVKPANLGSSVGISKAHTTGAAAEAMILAARYDRTVIVEEAVNGREIEVSVLGNDDPEASIPGEIIPGAEFYDYDDKYGGGAELLVPAPLSPGEAAEAQSMAVEAFRVLGVEGLARVDFLYEDGREGRGGRGWLVNELNTMPGFTPISMYPRLWDASGLGYPKLIDRMVELALGRHARRRDHTRTQR